LGAKIRARDFLFGDLLGGGGGGKRGGGKWQTAGGEKEHIGLKKGSPPSQERKGDKEKELGNQALGVSADFWANKQKGRKQINSEGR